MDEPMRVLLLERDLFFSVKIRDTLRHSGYETVTARNEGDFARKLAANPPTLAIVNTSLVGIAWEQVIATAKAAGVPTLAFGAHVDLEAQQAARRAGADRVISNSKLAKDLPAIVERLVRGGAGGAQATVAQQDTDEDDLAE
jgi:DNA-binding response OmpR family regulator